MEAAEVQGLWDVNDLARYLKMQPSTIYKKACKGELPRHKIGRLLRFRKDQIDAHIEAQSLPYSKPPSQSRFQSAKARLRSLTTEYSETASPIPPRREGE